MKILAVYGSRFGQARAVLGRIIRKLGDGGHSTTVVDGRSVPPGLAPEDFDAVIVVASVIMGSHQRYVRRWVRVNALALAGLPGAFISVNGASPDSSPDWRRRANGYLAQFVKRTGWHPRWTAVFPGALRYTRYNPITRWIMRRIAAKEGGPTDTSRDYEFTDWQAVDRFAERLADGFTEGAWDVAGPALR